MPTFENSRTFLCEKHCAQIPLAFGLNRSCPVVDIRGSGVVRGSSGGIRPGTQALEVYQHTLFNHKAKFTPKYVEKCVLFWKKKNRRSVVGTAP